MYSAVKNILELKAGNEELYQSLKTALSRDEKKQLKFVEWLAHTEEGHDYLIEYVIEGRSVEQIDLRLAFRYTVREYGTISELSNYQKALDLVEEWMSNNWARVENIGLS